MGIIYFVRHGQASLGAQNYDQLSDLGYAQAEQLGLYFLQQKIQFEAVYTGTLQRQKQNIEVQRRVSETTNTILQKNAEMLKQNSIDVAKENEKTVVSLETLKRTTSSLIETLNEVKQIHEAGAQSRRVLDGELKTLEAELKKNVTRVN